ncbi:GGDEF domain-containing protein [Devosia sp. A16]|uniref:GGDEF domain-containing protein n=1 Tax=Devosia sp. A16 TaxID=1736675 RepID=UPI0006D78811|nr:GGDEF domain-containing protein [Devosia sp. A16]
MEQALNPDLQLTEARRLGRSGEPAAALRVARQVAELTTEDATRLAALLRVAWHSLQLGEANAGLAAAVAARRLAEELGNADRRAAAHSLAAWLLLELGLTDEAYLEADTAVAMAEADGAPLTLAHALNSKGMALLYSQHADLAEQHFRWAVKVAGEVEDASALSLFLSNLAYALADLADGRERAGDPEEAKKHRNLAVDLGIEAVDTARSCGDGWMLRLALTNTVEYLGLQGQLEMARALLLQWPQTPGTPGIRETVHHLYTDGELRMREGDLEGARRMCSEAFDLAEASGHTDHQMNCLRRLAEIAERAGDLATALYNFKRYHDSYRRNEGEQARRRAQAAQIHFESQHHRAEAERLAAEVLRDPLTGIANRRALEQQLQAVAGEPHSIAIVDIDHFKAINDNHSHMLGDEVLRQVSRLLDGVPASLAARLGGEEFALLFSGNDRNDREACEAVRREIADYPWSRLAPGLAVTVSIGLAAAEANAPEPALARADRRLYAAKSAGRNRVVADDAVSEARAIAHRAQRSPRYAA